MAPVISYRAFQIHLDVALRVKPVELSDILIVHCKVDGLAVVHPLQHCLQLCDLVLILLEQGIFGVLVHLWLVLDCLRSGGVP